ncbi:cytochrome c [Novosphingobium mangrovi (ex Huang et al. 2023)]|uniref:Cytochrome c n=1 Tax=Novosphingobium mangrovi (ex Huang et al. 2023) TaxID=2976432 RepID=A0ABT2I7U3_9SPHN|nr:cytochrome c [Novosphingobium mangrovi (ex Huang et al. 2023)]MCT2400617.1 cytochrome c [Novosphingobium mangrovi (ex Huang et al. 2023)]
MRIRLAAFLAVFSSGCTATAAPPAVTASPLASAERGLSFAQERCASCHGVVPNTVSPNPESPPFEDIANRNGLTVETLGQFLVDSHNFPVAMDFTVTRTQARDLATWMLTMRKAGHQPQH